jgi:hypothetical protein
MWVETKENVTSFTSAAAAGGAAARTLGIGIDALRTWKRNGLLRVGKNRFGCCAYSELDLARIRPGTTSGDLKKARQEDVKTKNTCPRRTAPWRARP